MEGVIEHIEYVVLILFEFLFELLAYGETLSVK